MNTACVNADMLRDLYSVAIESLRNAYDLLIGYLPQWFMLKVKFVAEAVLVERLIALWTALGVAHEWVEQFVWLGVYTGAARWLLQPLTRPTRSCLRP